MKVLRIILGVFLLVMGANKFLGFMPPMNMSTEASNFMGSLVETGYMMPMVGVVEILCGALFLFGSTAPIGTVLLAPLSVNVLSFHLFLDPSSIWFAGYVFAMNVIFAGYYFNHYRPIFAKIFSERVEIQEKDGALRGSVIAIVNGQRDRFQTERKKSA